MVALYLSTTTAFSQELIINEVSQGPGNQQEYVEFVVSGDFTCEATPCMDLRNVIFDDNNGPTNNGSVSNGAMRFANVDFWSCIPQGTLILVYNATSKNSAIPVDDLRMDDGNFTLVIPSNSDLFDHNLTAPNSTVLVSGYPGEDAWETGGDWSTVRMQNGTDLFQIVNTLSGLNPSFSVAWGSANGTIRFQGTADGRVFSFVNTLTNDPSDQANWVSRSVNDAQTPGVANSPENGKWLELISRKFGQVAPLNMALMIQNESCLNTCDGAIEAKVIGGFSPFTFSNSTGDSSSQIYNLCAGTYTIKVQDKQGCEQLDTIFIGPEQNEGKSLFSSDPVLSSGETKQFSPVKTGGKWSATCGTCIDQEGNFDSEISGVGSFEVTYIVGVNECADTTIRIQKVAGHFKNDLPNVFTPNGDGVNDFIDFKSQNYSVVTGVITDRWGNLVYTYREGQTRWFGNNLNGEKLNAGTYFYRFVYRNLISGEEHEIQGFISLVD